MCTNQAYLTFIKILAIFVSTPAFVGIIAIISVFILLHQHQGDLVEDVFIRTLTHYCLKLMRELKVK